MRLSVRQEPSFAFNSLCLARGHFGALLFYTQLPAQNHDPFQMQTMQQDSLDFKRCSSFKVSSPHTPNMLCYVTWRTKRRGNPCLASLGTISVGYKQQRIWAKEIRVEVFKPSNDPNGYSFWFRRSAEKKRLRCCSFETKPGHFIWVYFRSGLGGQEEEVSKEPASNSEGTECLRSQHPISRSQGNWSLGILPALLQGQFGPSWRQIHD